MTQTGTVTLADFLLARIAEDERAARECAKVYPSPWEVSDRGHSAKVVADAPNFHHVVDLDQGQIPVGTVEWLGDAIEHVARHDPARMLAECEAKRRIIAEHSDERDHGNGRITHTGVCDTCGEDVGRDVDDQYPCRTLQLLALPYADHPDYRDEWRP